MTASAPTPSPSPMTPAPTAPKRLYRSRDDRKLGGVCGGLGAYLGIDPTLVRILTVASLFLPGPQLIAYLVAWIIVPEEPYAAPAPAPATTAPPVPVAADPVPPAAGPVPATAPADDDGEAGSSTSPTAI
jgi:phage shock protein C